MHAHQPAGPYFFDARFIAGATELQHAAAAVVTARDEQQVVGAPNRRARVQAEVDRMRMTPKQVAVVWIDAYDFAKHERHELVLPVNVDDDRRRSRVFEVVFLPRD